MLIDIIVLASILQFDNVGEVFHTGIRMSDQLSPATGKRNVVALSQILIRKYNYLMCKKMLVDL